MGFFGSLFEKRQCSICGKEMGLTERKELSGGNLCDDCAEKLSLTGFRQRPAKLPLPSRFRSISLIVNRTGRR